MRLSRQYVPDYTRKAGGVYYTPQYIVEYIVENTVGKLIENKTPEEIAQLKIVDPACGSGSFLIGAYQHLLNYHQQYYKPKFDELSKIASSNEHNNKQRTDAIKERNKLPLTPDGNLTTAAKKQILLNNILGVDIDAQAVEVTKLSLMLKCMEGETKSSLAVQMQFGERVLPTLDDNIKSGNSLIDIDFYDGLLDFEPGIEKKVKPFSWENAFPKVFKQDGFDCVIGNPPYGALFNASELDYFKNNYKTSIWRGESYLLFVEKGINLMCIEGLIGFIIPDTLLNLGFTQSLREYILSNSKIDEIVCLPSNVFAGATVDTILLFCTKKKTVEKFHPSNISIKTFGKKDTITKIENASKIFYAEAKDWSEQKSFNVKADQTEKVLIEKIETGKKRISEIAEMFYGIKAYQVGKGKPAQSIKIRDEKPFTSDKRIDDSWLPFYDGKHIGRYQLNWKNNNYVKYGKWLAEPRNSSLFEGEKILIRKIIGKTIIATYISETSYCNTLLFVLKLKIKEYSYKSILAILNSDLIGWYFRNKFQISNEDTFPQIMIRDILQFPIPVIDKNNDEELNKLVNNILPLIQEKQQTATPDKLDQLNTRIKYNDDKINILIFDLYGLSEEEREIVEEN